MGADFSEGGNKFCMRRVANVRLHGQTKAHKCKIVRSWL